MDANKLNQLKKQLTDELMNLQSHIHEVPTAENSELSSVETHPADAATDLTTVTTEIAMDDFKEEEIEKIQLALKAIKEGTYGQCIECHKEIPYERLEVVPTALTCVEHSDDV
ncbi:molecular chaperone DnaK [Solibacillus sp. R5-41]|uniref:TraR/DksA family transcriptional regulator n=1 Tax=Solibacillus sp. R5-41 TaxID=2048654 RepID=UPI000C127228|nr:TraR/DksA C4-type zinc finger protein [Solibacillus sp. R5-41]ATP41537.1 molecular chaperone DnaK [Solibacillus sp. R5-41]